MYSRVSKYKYAANLQTKLIVDKDFTSLIPCFSDSDVRVSVTWVMLKLENFANVHAEKIRCKFTIHV